MQSGKFNLVVDGQWGSTGKGLVSSYLTIRHQPAILSTTNMANAGHTVVDSDGKSFVAKVLPSSAVLNAWYRDYNPQVVVGPSAAFHLDRLLEEARECDLDESNLNIHPRAGVITQAHRDAEADLDTGTKHVASTMQGCGTFLADKVMRRKSLKLAGDYPELAPFIHRDGPLPFWLMSRMGRGDTVLHEGSQGFSLDIHHGSHYPNCTSRQTTAMQCVADMGIPPALIGDIYLVIRPYPIRVGNVVENGQTLGNSGGHYPDNEEISWQQVGEEAGMPPAETEALLKKELTTVTKRLRRVFTFSRQQVREAAYINGATKIALNFANYVDWRVHGVTSYDQLTQKVRDFINMVEDVTGIQVALVGTGPQLDQVVDLT